MIRQQQIAWAKGQGPQPPEQQHLAQQQQQQRLAEQQHLAHAIWFFPHLATYSGVVKGL